MPKEHDMTLPIMRKATAVWLVDNTTLSFKQISEFCGLHDLEVQGIADGEVAVGIKGFDPIVNNQLTAEEIVRGESDPKAKLSLKHIPNAEGERKRKGPKYTPLSKRQDKPAAIAWLVKHHAELTDGQIGKLVGTTKTTIVAIRDRTHWNVNNLVPVDPVAVGLCSQVELDEAVSKTAKKVEERNSLGVGETLVSVEESLAEKVNVSEEFLGNINKDDKVEADDIDPDSLFNLPS